MKEIQGFTNDYRAIGEDAELSGYRLNLYVAYMSARWPNGQDSGYAYEWAERFLSGYEWHYSDMEGRGILADLRDKIE